MQRTKKVEKPPHRVHVTYCDYCFSKISEGDTYYRVGLEAFCEKCVKVIHGDKEE